MPETSSVIAQISPSNMEGWEVYTEAVERRQQGQSITMLAIGDHDFNTPSPTVEACKKALDEGFHDYVDIQGVPELLQAMAKITTQISGLKTSTDEIVATTGGQGALYAGMQAILDPGDHIIIVSPHYVTFPATARAAGAQFTLVDAFAEDGFEPKAAAIRAALKNNTKAILINSPNNPTCAVYSRKTHELIADLCIERDLWLVSDEVYWSMAGEKHFSPRSLPCMRERTLVVNSLSKSHGMTGWRVGWLTAPPQVVSHIVQLNLVSNYGLPDFISRAAAEALDKGYGVEEIAATYKARGEALVDALKETNCVRPVNDPGSMYIVLDVRDVTADGREFAWKLLDEESIAVMPGESFGRSLNGHVRISLCVPEDELKTVAEKICRFVANYSN